MGWKESPLSRMLRSVDQGEGEDGLVVSTLTDGTAGGWSDAPLTRYTYKYICEMD